MFWSPTKSHGSSGTARSAKVIPLATALFLGLAVSTLTAQAEPIYRGLLQNNQGILDLRSNRFHFNPGLSFNKDLANVGNYDCALALYTNNAIPNVDDTSTIYGFELFEATFDENPPNPPAGHVSVTPVDEMDEPSVEFAETLRAEARADPQNFNERNIFGVNATDDECRDRPKWLQGM